MKRPFQVGDRVVVYGVLGIHPCDPSEVLYANSGYRGQVTSRFEANPVTVRLDGYGIIPAGHLVEIHPKQCRRLKKARRRVWINSYPDGSLGNTNMSLEGAQLMCGTSGVPTEFVEVCGPRTGRGSK